MLQQAIDFRDESDALFALIEPLADQDWNQKTQFKAWTINDVIAHLHMGNYAADLSLQDSEAFSRLRKTFHRRAQARQGRCSNPLTLGSKASAIVNSYSYGRTIIERWPIDSLMPTRRNAFYGLVQT